MFSSFVNRSLLHALRLRSGEKRREGVRRSFAGAEEEKRPSGGGWWWVHRLAGWFIYLFNVSRQRVGAKSACSWCTFCVIKQNGKRSKMVVMWKGKPVQRLSDVMKWWHHRAASLNINQIYYRGKDDDLCNHSEYLSWVNPSCFDI